MTELSAPTGVDVLDSPDTARRLDDFFDRLADRHATRAVRRSGGRSRLRSHRRTHAGGEPSAHARWVPAPADPTVRRGDQLHRKRQDPGIRGLDHLTALGAHRYPSDLSTDGYHGQAS
jgi:hypothetical protein